MSNDLEPRSMRTAPDNLPRHNEILAGILRRFLNGQDASLARTFTSTMETSGLVLTINGVHELNSAEEVEAIAIENNREALFGSAPKEDGAE